MIKLLITVALLMCVVFVFAEGAERIADGMDQFSAARIANFSNALR